MSKKTNYIIWALDIAMFFMGVVSVGAGYEDGVTYAVLYFLLQIANRLG